MEVQKHIEKYIASQAEPKRYEIETLNKLILQVSPNCRQWFLDGKDEKGNLFPILK